MIYGKIYVQKNMYFLNKQNRGMNEMAEECFVCGNTNEEEIEYRTVILDDGLREVRKKEWVCKDEDDCGMRIYGNKNQFQNTIQEKLNNH